MIVSRLGQAARRYWARLWFAAKKFTRIDGTESAAAFAYYAFFSLIPLIALFVTMASVFTDRDRAAREVIAYVEARVPIGSEKQSYIFNTIAGVENSRGKAGAVALIVLVWAAMQFFTALIGATNRAWGVRTYKWWRLPIKSLNLLAIMVSMVLLGIALPVLVRMARVGFLPITISSAWGYALGGMIIPFLGMFFSLCLFYKLVPRRPTRFAEVWSAALFSAVFLRAAETIFAIYINNFSSLNAIYGAFGGIMALLLWIYFSGCIVIFGACLCAVQAEDALQRQK